MNLKFKLLNTYKEYEFLSTVSLIRCLKNIILFYQYRFPDKQFELFVNLKEKEKENVETIV